MVLDWGRRVLLVVFAQGVLAQLPRALSADHRENLTHPFRRAANLEERRACVVSPNAPPVFITSAFDGGNIEVESAECAADGGGAVVRLRIRADPHSQLEQTSFFQWFAFRAMAAASSTKTVHYHIINAGEAAYAKAWEGYAVCASLNRREWSRCWKTTYDQTSGTLSWTFDHGEFENSPVYFSYFDLYPHDRHLDLIARAAASPRASVLSLGHTLEGRDIEAVIVGSGPVQVGTPYYPPYSPPQPSYPPLIPPYPPPTHP